MGIGGSFRFGGVSEDGGSEAVEVDAQALRGVGEAVQRDAGLVCGEPVVDELEQFGEFGGIAESDAGGPSRTCSTSQMRGVARYVGREKATSWRCPLGV
ncbi:hypothetical protein ACIHDR_48985 [Nocardia sp. NPDC052278]|uniref:hypothetical protein n=1 Tax=unclassified Nocardia TaxID=2637762 RepID=UPI00368B2A67